MHIVYNVPTHVQALFLEFDVALLSNFLRAFVLLRLVLHINRPAVRERPPTLSNSRSSFRECSEIISPLTAYTGPTFDLLFVRQKIPICRCAPTQKALVSAHIILACVILQLLDNTRKR